MKVEALTFRTQLANKGMLIINVMIAAFLISIILQIAIGSLLPSDEGVLHDELILLLVFTLPTLLGFIVFPIIFIKLTHKISFQEVGMDFNFNLLARMSLILSFFAIGFTVFQLGLPSWVALVHFAAIGFGEEILFRGVMLGQLLKFMNPILSIVLSSIVFAFVFHSGEPFMDNVIARLPLGLILGAIFYYTKNVYVVGSLHWAYNFSLGLFE